MLKKYIIAEFLTLFQLILGRQRNFYKIIYNRKETAEERKKRIIDIFGEIFAPQKIRRNL